MADSPLLSRFTPSRTAPEILERIFVQRQALAEFAVERVEASVDGGKHHLLLIGPRGSGKTHFVSLIFHRLTLKDDLRDRLRIAWLNEDETSSTFAKLLLRIHRALGERYADEFPPIDVTPLGKLDVAGRNEQLSRLLVERLAGRTLLVVVENLDDLFKTLGEDGQKELRAFLQEHAVATILATSQQLFDGVSSRELPFFGFFEIEHLKPLGIDDAVSLLRKIAEEVKSDPELASFLLSPTGRDRVRAIHHLSGGNHRIYIVLSDFITRESLDELVGPFEKMLDELTPYYQARLAWLSTQQREIVEFLCRMRQAVPVKTIATELLITPQSAAAQLKELKEKGYVQAATAGREARYELAEPLMRLCFEIKENNRRPIQLFVDFLRVWYRRDQLEQRLAALPVSAPVERLYIEHTLRSMRESSSDPAIDDDPKIPNLYRHPKEALTALERRAAERGRIQDWINLGAHLLNLGHHERALSAADETLAMDPENLAALYLQAIALLRLGRKDVALDYIGRVFAIPHEGALAWVMKGIALADLGREEEALACYDRAIAAEPDARAWHNKGCALTRLGRDEEALACCDRAVAAEPDFGWAWGSKGNALARLGRDEEALACYDRAINIDPDDDAALYNKGLSLARLGRDEEALACFDRAIDIDPELGDVWYRRAKVLRRINRLEESLTAYEKAVSIDRKWDYPPLARTEILFALKQWERGFESLGFALGRARPFFDLGKDSIKAILRAVLVAPGDRTEQEWRIRRLIALFAAAGALTTLGDALAHSLGDLPGTSLNDEALAAWGEAWHAAGDEHEELRLPLRLFDVGLRYYRTKDRRVLLDLISEERSLLEQALGLDSDAPQGTEA